MPPYLNFSPLAYRTPNFNPMADEEEERKRRALPLPAPLERPPAAPTRPMPLPDVAPLSRPAPLPSPTAPPGPAELPMTVKPFNPEPIRNYRNNVVRDEEDFARDQAIRGAMRPNAQGQMRVPRSWKTSLVNAGLGALRGVGATGSLGGALGGALAGGVGATISPLRGREAMFEAFQAPGIRAGIEKRQAEDELRLKQALDDLKRQEAEADIRLKDAQRIKTLTPPLTRPRTPQLKLGKNRETGEVRYFDPLDAQQNAAFEPYQFPRIERQPSASDQDKRAEAEETLADKGTVESIAQSYTDSQRESIIQSAPETFRSVLQSGKRADGKAATAKDLADADAWLRKKLADAYQKNLKNVRATREMNKAKRLQRPGAAPLSRPGGSQARKGSVSQEFIQHVSERLKISPEEARRRIEADGYTIK